jgi:hypothetical protein
MYDIRLYIQRVLWLCVNIQAVIYEVIPSRKCDMNIGLTDLLIFEVKE